MAIARITQAPIGLEQLAREVAAPGCGALVVFAGTVRHDSGGRAVRKITYEAYERMAETALARIVEELEATTPGLRVAIVHRLGEMAVGETSVAILTASPHRGAAYEANRLALERLKREAPIWKHEHYEDGASDWRQVEALDRPTAAGTSPRE